MIQMDTKCFVKLKLSCNSVSVSPQSQHNPRCHYLFLKLLLNAPESS